MTCIINENKQTKIKGKLHEDKQMVSRNMNTLASGNRNIGRLKLALDETRVKSGRQLEKRTIQQSQANNRNIRADTPKQDLKN